jgi:hypothetical protein
MIKRMQPVFAKIGYIISWLALSVFATLTAFQMHGTLIAISLVIIENPSSRPLGWSTDTVYALSRIFWLVLGIFWLGWVMFTEGYLSEGYQQLILKKRIIRLTVILAVTYGACLLILLILR